MHKNMGTADRVIRAILALTVAFLYFTDRIDDDSHRSPSNGKFLSMGLLAAYNRPFRRKDCDRHFNRNRVNHEAGSPNARRYFPLDEAGRVLDNFMQRTGDKPGDNQPHPFFDPSADKRQQAGDH